MVELAVTGAAQPTLPFSVYGTIAMARTEDEPDSATSQVRLRHLPGATPPPPRCDPATSQVRGPLRGAKQRLARLAGHVTGASESCTSRGLCTSGGPVCLRRL